MGKTVNIPKLLGDLRAEREKLLTENTRLLKEKKRLESNLVVAQTTIEALRQDNAGKKVEAEDPVEPVSEEPEKMDEEVSVSEGKALDFFSRSYLLMLAFFVVLALGFFLGYLVARGFYSPDGKGLDSQVEMVKNTPKANPIKPSLTPIPPQDDIDIYCQDAGVSLWRLTPPVQPIVPPDILLPVKEEKIVSQPGPKIGVKKEVSPKATPVVKSRFPQDKRVSFRKVLVDSPEVAKKKPLAEKKIQSKPKTTASPAAPVILSAPVTYPGFKLKFVGRWWKEPFEIVE